MLNFGLESFCPFCLQAFESAEQRTVHLIFDRCERRFLKAEEPVAPALPQSAGATTAAAAVVYAN